MAEKEKSKDKSKELMVLSWKSDGALPQLCQIISLLALVTVIAQFVVGIMLIFSGGPNWPIIAFSMITAIAAKLLGNELGTKKIYMTKNRIIFSLAFFIELRGKLRRKWTDIGAIALQDEEAEMLPTDDEERRQMVFHFASGGSTRVALRDLTVGDLDILFKGSKRWGSTAVMAPELIELRRKLVAGPSPTTNLSLTTLWHRELESHFTTSTFVPLSTGTTLNKNRFRVISQIGAGGMSAIYLARASDNKKVILKELVVHKSSETGMQKAKELFQRESGLLVKLRHPQIARVYDHFIENGRDYLVLEYIPGMSLRQLVDLEGVRLEDKVLDWAQAIASILQYLHTQNPPIIHRDVSPENLVLGEDNLVHLIDFGAANEFAATATGTLIGKQSYIAPEQFRGKPKPASDIYSLGATMHFLLTGQDPEALSVSRPDDVNSKVSKQVSDFVASLTAIDVNERPQSCDEVIKQIVALRATDRGVTVSLGKK